MKKINVFWQIVILIISLAIFVINKITLDNRMLSLACVAIVIIVFVGKYIATDDEKVVEEEIDEELLTDEEMEEALLDDGEFSYDNYDEVCCPECGEYLGKGVTVCESCGYGKSNIPSVCPNCGRDVEDDLDFCAYCNYEFK